METKKRAIKSLGKANELKSDKAIRWIEKYCRIPDGQYVGKPLTLCEFMKEDLRAIYDNPHGTRTAIISRGRKNAKTVEAALIVLLHLCGPFAKHNSQLNSTATSRDQAAVLFSLASKIVRLSPVLRDNVIIRDTAKQLACPEIGTMYRALSADASTAYGLSPALTVHDELGQVRGPKSELFEALETATAAHESPLSVIISTQAPNNNDLLSILIDNAKTGADPRTVLRMSSAPEEIDPFSEEAIRAANPAFDEFMNKAEVLGMANSARHMPIREAEYRNLVLNQRVESASPFVTKNLWALNGADPAPLKGGPVYGGLDLSSVNDLTALVLMGRRDGVWGVHPTFWLPAQGLAEKSRQDRQIYDIWAREGHLNAAPGKSIDYEYVAGFLRAQFEKYDIRKIAFDRWNFQHLKSWLLKAGFSENMISDRFVEFGQGFQSMSPALRYLEGELLNARVAHGMHPVLTMCAANAVAVLDPAGNRKLAKNKSTGRIDGMVALAMAFGVAPVKDNSLGYIKEEVLVL